MKPAVILAAVLCAALPAAHALDPLDQGEYVLLAQGRPSALQMRFGLTDNNRWTLERREGRGEWHPACESKRGCRLRPASAKAAESYRARLTPHWHDHNFSCVKNAAFAFCHAHVPNRPERRAYWWFPLLEKDARPIPANRLR